MADAKTRIDGTTIAAAVAAAAILVSYILFIDSGLGDRLYKWSKSFASYEWRQHLGLSKRYLLQWGHIVFLFLLLLLSKYIIVDRRPEPAWLGQIRETLSRYAPAIFLFHFPLMYFFAAVTRHDATSDRDQTVLLVLVLAGSAAFGWLCFWLNDHARRIGPWARGRFRRLDERFSFLWSKSKRRPAPAARVPYPPPNFGAFLDWVKIAATMVVVLGHFSFKEFSTWDIPGFGGATPRFAVPTFFLISGYLAMMSIDLASRGFLETLFRRWWRLAPLVVPMLLIVPILDHIGFATNREVYFANEGFVTDAGGGPPDLGGFFLTLLSSLLYLNEIWIFNLLHLGTELGGVRAFSNDAFWFMCYLFPFNVLLAICTSFRGKRRYFAVLAFCVFVGPPILLLAPLFFAGSVAYLIHRRV